jgi:hypothetical protein
MLNNLFGRSLALGFWAKHAQAMSALYELSNTRTLKKRAELEVNAALAELWSGPRQQDIRAVIQNAEADGRAFFDKGYEAVC